MDPALAEPQLIVANLFIGTGYLIAAFFVIPKFTGMSGLTKVFGFLFLMTCGVMNHYELAAHTAVYGFIPAEALFSHHMVFGHLLQALASVGFIGGVARDIARGGDPFMIRNDDSDNRLRRESIQRRRRDKLRRP